MQRSIAVALLYLEERTEAIYPSPLFDQGGLWSVRVCEWGGLCIVEFVFFVAVSEIFDL